MLRTLVTLEVLALSLVERAMSARSDDRGQSTAEYALVLLGAAGVALLLVAWATKTGKVGHLLDAILDRVLDQVA